ncbi:hypothetical protein Sango_2057400 [Sesamum angolense]|uniref:Uncharacterized protein n=1 Tax=Sesamum angolense TaxID=2727404 RepID=A0AAE2BP93_9LAMI|nr:hypothetical protein Sango_2057400 [Sesamum angolense]
MAVNVASFKLWSKGNNGIPENNVPYKKPQRNLTLKDKVMQVARQSKISLEEDSAATNLVSTKCGSLDGKRASCNTTQTINKDGLLKKKDSSNAIECMSTIIFIDEALLLGSKPRNHPLFVAGYAREQKVNRILIDGGSAINILPLRTLKKFGIPMDELSNSRPMIQCFNQGA